MALPSVNPKPQPHDVTLTIKGSGGLDGQGDGPRELNDDELLSVFHDDHADLSLLTGSEQQRLLTLTDDHAAPEQKSEGAVSRLGRNYAEAILPSTTASDYIEGPVRAVTHPLDSLSLLFGGVKDAATDQAVKTKEAIDRTKAAPTLLGKLAGASEVIGHGAATAIPFVGPGAAQAGEQIAEGDWAGGAGRMLGLLTPFGVGKAAELSAPLRASVADRIKAGNVTRMEKALAATTNENKTRAQRVAPEMLKRGIWNSDLPKLEARAASESETAGKAVGAELSNVASKETDVQPLIDSLEKAKASAVDTNKAGARVVIEPDQVKAIDALQDTLRQYGDKISMRSLNKVRLKWDEVVQSSKGFTTPDVGWKAWASREGRSVLRDALSTASPNVDAVMAEYAFWQNIEDITHATNRRRVGQSGGLLPTIAGGAGAVVAEAVMPGSSMALKLGGAALGAKLAANVRRFLGSPGWQMFSAVQRQRFADALAGGNKAQIASMIGAASKGSSAQSGMRAPAFPVNVTRKQDTHEQQFVGR